jgi:hypothetical protein
MIYFIIKCLLSGLIIAVVSEVAKRSPALGALVVSLPLVSLLGILSSEAYIARFGSGVTHRPEALRVRLRTSEAMARGLL